MNVVRFADAPAYEAPGHEGMRMARLQGREAGRSDLLWLGLSTIKPGGGITISASGVEKFYVVLEGELSISNGREEATLSRLDSCRIAAGEPREIRNDASRDAVVLLAMPLSPEERR